MKIGDSIMTEVSKVTSLTYNSISLINYLRDLGDDNTYNHLNRTLVGANRNIRPYMIRHKVKKNFRDGNRENN